MSMAAPGSLTPLPSPASPASPLRHGTPFPFKVKSQFLYRLAQESENNSTTTTTTTTTATTTTTTATTTIPVQRPPPPLHRIADHPRVKCVYTITPHSLSPTHITQSSITSPTPHILTPAHTPSFTPAHTPTHITPSSLSSPPTSPGVIAEDTRGGTNLTPESPVFQTPLPFVHPLLRTSPLAYPPYAHAHAHAHAQAQAHAHAHRRHLSESDLQRRQGGMYWDTAHLRHLQKLESRQRAYRHSLYHAHSYHRSRPRHSSSGVDGPIMLSEEVKGPYLDGLPSLEPTVSSKDVKESTKDEVRQDYMKKAVSEWTTDDVVDFLMGTHTHADYDFSIINTMNGAQLMRQSREFFLRFSPEYGEDLYNEVQRRVLERATSITSTPYQVSLSSTTTTSPLQRPFLLTAPPHTLRHLSPQPSVICDAQAPYELVIDPQAQLRFAPDPRDPSVYEQTHRGAMKIVPPPLVALERREERQVTGDRGVGAGSSGEQVQGVKEEVKIEPPKKRGPGRPKKPESELKKKKKKTGRLWEFIRNLLLNPETCPSMVKWENPEEGLFRFIDGEKVAKRWGERKGNKEMNYEKLSRAMRYYYKTQIFEAVIGRRLVYKFGKKASGWRTSNPNFANPPENPSLEEPTPAAAPPPPPPHHHHYDQLHSDLKPKTSQGDLVLSSPQHHHYEQLHTDLKQKTSQGDLVLSSPQHHHYEQLHTDLKQKTSQGDLVLSPPQHHLHHYTTQLLLPELKAPPPPAHHYKENFLSSPHAQDTKSHLTHPLSLTMHHTPHHHHHHHHT